MFCLRWLRYFAAEIIHLVTTPCCLIWVVPDTYKAPINVVSFEAVVWRMEQMSSTTHYRIAEPIWELGVSRWVILWSGQFPFRASTSLSSTIYFLRLGKEGRQHLCSSSPFFFFFAHPVLTQILTGWFSWLPSAFSSCLVAARYSLQSRPFLLGWGPSWSSAGLKLPSFIYQGSLVTSD